VDTNGKFFIVDYGNYRIRLVETNSIISTFAGSGIFNPFNGDNIPALSANINLPRDVKGDTLGNIYIADHGNCIIRMVDTRGIISTLFGTPGICGFPGEFLLGLPLLTLLMESGWTVFRITYLFHRFQLHSS
jgi:hypothetical protein